MNMPSGSRVTLLWCASVLLSGACGQRNVAVPRDAGFFEAPPSLGDASASVDRPTDGASDAGDAGVTPQNCAYPNATGLKFLPAVPGLVPFGGATECRYATTAALTLPTLEDSTLAFAYDLNADGIDDPVFRPASRAASGPRLRTFLSGPSQQGTLAYEESQPCAALDSLPDGRVMLRDVNRDGVVDFLVGSGHGMSIWLNLPAGLKKVLEHNWLDAGLGWQALLNVAVRDLDGDGLDDVVFGYDRSIGAIEFELGAISFRGLPLNGQLQFVQDGIWTWRTGPPQSGPPQYLGYVAADRSAPGSGTVFLLGGPSVGHFLVVDASTGHPAARPAGLLSPAGEQAFATWVLRFGGRPALAVLYTTRLRIYDTERSQLPLLVEQPTASVQDFDHELGGGAQRPSRFMSDIEGDGDIDFIEVANEFTTAGIVRSRLFIHDNVADARFAVSAPLPLPAPPASDAETPFLAIGKSTTALMVTDPVYVNSDAGPTTVTAPTIVPIGCTP